MPLEFARRSPSLLTSYFSPQVSRRLINHFWSRVTMEAMVKPTRVMTDILMAKMKKAQRQFLMACALVIYPALEVMRVKWLKIESLSTKWEKKAHQIPS
jgi:hypothetical protein